MKKTTILTIFTFIFSLSLSHTYAQPQKIEHQTLEVRVYKVEGPRPVSSELRYPGRTKSISEVTVVARVSGILKEKYFTEGQFIRKNEPLFKIEPDIYQAEYDTARAMVEHAQVELNRTEREWQRIKASYEDRVASEQQRDSALFAYEQAKAMLEAAKARLKQSEINLRYTDVKAPISGIAGERLIDSGNMVNPGTSLVTITEIDPIYVEFSIPDTDIRKFGRRTSGLKSWKAELLIDDKPYGYTGRIDFVDSHIDEKTSSVSVRAVFKNPERSLLPGQFVRVRLRGTPRKAIMVPQKAVIQSRLGSAVYVVDNGRAMIRNIRIGDRAGEYFIVEDGLKPGDMVIVDNLMKLRPEMPVRISQQVNR